ncbi:MAG: T9SS type A sorting domain-containing protein [Ignavibacteriales bacterium]|nr:T9SS type A sorting domain-containing protein [Ignavibacteriales bacterium]
MKRTLLHFCMSLAVCAMFFALSQRPALQKFSITEDLPRPVVVRDPDVHEGKADEADAPEEFERYERDIRTRDGEAGPAYSPNYKILEVQKAVERKAASLNKVAALPWSEVGPGNVGGRTRGMIVDPDDATKNTWFAGSVGGGIWKTTNAGSTWTNKTPGLPNLATVTLAMAASNHLVIYAGTGEGFGNTDAIRGDGIWKSTNRGETWTQLASTASNTDFSYVNRVIVDPANANVVFAATNTGIFRSTDGGSTWTAVYSSGGNGGSFRIQQIIANPQNFNTLYATRNSNGVLKSRDRGLTWSASSTGVGSGARGELDISPADTARLFLAVETSSTVSDLYVSDDAGTSWAKAAHNSGTPPNWLNGQGWYDNAVAAHPYDRDICYVGGLDIYKVQITAGTSQTPGVLDVTQNGTSSFLSFVNWGGPYAGGGIGTGKDFYGTTSAPVSLADSEYTSIEIRFGPGLSQKAHRFVSGASFQYPYLDYVTVPFQVWDVTRNRQLMASWRDTDTSGVYKLIPYDAANPQREYIFVHAVPYDPLVPNGSIAITGGERYKNIYALWPVLTTGGTWTASNLPTSNVRINYGLIVGRTRTTARMTNWVQNQSQPYVHADHHNITIIPLNQSTQSFRMLNGSDGGVGISDNSGTSFANPNLGYNTSQFYGVDKKPGESQYIGGTQDNGTWLSPAAPTATSSWTAVIGGDGFASIWNYKDPSKIIGTLYYNDIRRSTNGGTSFSSATGDLTDVGSGLGPFITQVGKSNSDPDMLFVVGSTGVWRSDNFADNWTQFTIASANWGFGTGANAEISVADPQVVWAGIRMSNGGTTGKIHVSTNGGVTFSPTTNYASATLGRLSGLATHPKDSRTAFALFSFAKGPKVLRTTDLGQSWQDISGFGSGTASTNGFPDVATYSLLVMPHNPNEIWAGTEIGLFISTNNGVSWTYSNDVLPAVAIWQMRVVDDEIVVATHGRGIWSVKIPALLTAPPPTVTLSPRLNKPAQGPDGGLGINISLRSGYDSTQVFVKGAKYLTLASNASAKDTIVRFQVAKAESLTMSVTSFKAGKPYVTPVRGTNVILAQAPRTSYVDNFNAATSNFALSGMTRQRPSGFADSAYGSPHNYSSNRNYTLTLTIPITVQPTNAFLRFDEVVLVEPGEPGSLYGSTAFYDYCVVEATKDGATWIPIEDGYDSRREADWLSAWNAKTAGTPSLMKKHVMNLLGRFSPGDVVFIRFRMYSDPGTTGWGWLIDNLEIQGSLVSVEHDKQFTPASFALAQNYPNPFNPSTTIRFDVPVQARVTLTIYDALGRRVKTLVDRQLNPGTYSEQWNAVAFSSGVYYCRMDAKESAQGSNRQFSATTRLVLVK